jgi:soluble lytic murein transglycosylase-like protein
MLRVAWCESKFDPGAYNRSSGASGVFQFIPHTWAWASAAVGQAQASPFDAAANVEAAAWLMKTQGPRHWTCH